VNCYECGTVHHQGKPLVLEGVTYHPFLIRFTTTDGRRHVKTLWAPALFALRDPVVRYLDDRGDVDSSKKVVVRCKKW